jgi:hypothetical protein
MNTRSILEKGGSMGNIERMKEKHKGSGEEREGDGIEELRTGTSKKRTIINVMKKSFKFGTTGAGRGNGGVEARAERGEKEVTIPKFKGKAY